MDQKMKMALKLGYSMLAKWSLFPKSWTFQREENQPTTSDIHHNLLHGYRILFKKLGSLTTI